MLILNFEVNDVLQIEATDPAGEGEHIRLCQTGGTACNA
jgi:hypothetical protein